MLLDLFSRGSFRSNVVNLSNGLEFGQVFLPALRQPTDDPGIREKLGEISLRDRKMQVFNAVTIFDRIDLALQAGQFPFQ